MERKQNKTKRIILIAIIVIAVALLLWKPFLYIKDIYTTEGILVLKEKIQNLGFIGVLVLFAIQLLQIVFIILPGEPIEILAGMCYGPFWGTVFLLISVFLVTTMIVLIVKKFGKKLLYKFSNKEKIDNLEKKLLKHGNNMQIILCVLFFIPGSPKDLLVFVGGLLPIKAWRFILIATFMRFPSIISSTMVGDNLLNGNLKTSIIIYGITFTIAIIALIIVRKKDKNKKLQGLF